MICSDIRLLRPMVYLSIFIQDRTKWLQVSFLTVRPMDILFGLFLSLFLLCVTYANEGRDDPHLPYSKNIVMDNEYLIQTWNDEFANQSIKLQVYPADMDKLNWCYCLNRSQDEMPIFQTVNSRSFAGQLNASNILFGRYLFPTVMLMKSGNENIDKDSWMSWDPIFCLFIACVIILNILFFARKLILVAYGYKTGYSLRGDRKKLQEIARKETSETRRWLFNLANTLLYVLTIFMIIFFILKAVLGILKTS